MLNFDKNTSIICCDYIPIVGYSEATGRKLSPLGRHTDGKFLFRQVGSAIPSSRRDLLAH